MSNTAVNNIIFFGIEGVGILAFYLLCKYAWKRSVLFSVLLAALSSVLFAFLVVFILGTFNRL
jgi:hypothetical protein